MDINKNYKVNLPMIIVLLIIGFFIGLLVGFSAFYVEPKYDLLKNDNNLDYLNQIDNDSVINYLSNNSKQNDTDFVFRIPYPYEVSDEDLYCKTITGVGLCNMIVSYTDQPVVTYIIQLNMDEIVEIYKEKIKVKYKNNDNVTDEELTEANLTREEYYELVDSWIDTQIFNY